MGNVIKGVLALGLLLGVLVLGLKEGALPASRPFRIVRKNESPAEFNFMIVLICVGAMMALSYTLYSMKLIGNVPDWKTQ